MKKRDDVLVGLVMAVAIIVAIIGSLWLARGGLSKGYALYAKFPWSSGLKQGQPVLLAGVNVGYVDGAQLRNDGTVLTTFRIGKEYKVPLGTTATVVPNGIFGDMAIALTPKGPNSQSIPPNDTVPVGPSSPGIAELTGKADSIATSVNTITTALQRELIAAGGVADLRKSLAGMNQLVSQLTVIAAEQNRQMSATFASLRRATSGVDSAKIDSTMKNVREASANMAALSADLKQTSMKLDSIVAKVDNGTGTVGKALNDPGAYNDVRALIQHMDSLITDVKKNPKRYINVRVF
jgi:phospholipid/cholesterol/gamma-HCH transport system substrate-binding protein